MYRYGIAFDSACVQLPLHMRSRSPGGPVPSGDVFDAEKVEDAQQERIESAIAYFYAELNVSSLARDASTLPTPFPSVSTSASTATSSSSAAAASELETCPPSPSLSDGEQDELMPNFELFPAFVLPHPVPATPPAAAASPNALRNGSTARMASLRRTPSGAAGVEGRRLCWNGTDVIHEIYR